MTDGHDNAFNELFYNYLNHILFENVTILNFKNYYFHNLSYYDFYLCTNYVYSYGILKCVQLV